MPNDDEERHEREKCESACRKVWKRRTDVASSPVNPIVVTITKSRVKIREFTAIETNLLRDWCEFDRNCDHNGESDSFTPHQPFWLTFSKRATRSFGSQLHRIWHQEGEARLLDDLIWLGLMDPPEQPTWMLLVFAQARAFGSCWWQWLSLPPSFGHGYQFSFCFASLTWQCSEMLAHHRSGQFGCCFWSLEVRLQSHNEGSKWVLQPEEDDPSGEKRTRDLSVTREWGAREEQVPDDWPTMITHHVPDLAWIILMLLTSPTHKESPLQTNKGQEISFWYKAHCHHGEGEVQWNWSSGSTIRWPMLAQGTGAKAVLEALMCELRRLYMILVLKFHRFSQPQSWHRVR